MSCGAQRSAFEIAEATNVQYSRTTSRNCGMFSDSAISTTASRQLLEAFSIVETEVSSSKPFLIFQCSQGIPAPYLLAAVLRAVASAAEYAKTITLYRPIDRHNLD